MFTLLRKIQVEIYCELLYWYYEAFIIIGLNYYNQPYIISSLILREIIFSKTKRNEKEGEMKKNIGNSSSVFDTCLFVKSWQKLNIQNTKTHQHLLKMFTCSVKTWVHHSIQLIYE